MATFDADEVARFRIAVAKIGKGVDRLVDAGDLTRTQVSVLSTIARLGPVGAGELAQHEGLNPTMLSRVVGKLEAGGLVTRSPDPDDKRVARLAATPAGRALHQRVRRDRTKVFSRTLGDIGPQHAAALLAALPALEALSRAVSPFPAVGATGAVASAAAASAAAASAAAAAAAAESAAAAAAGSAAASAQEAPTPR